jgi:predicted metal-dependent peptidase
LSLSDALGTPRIHPWGAVSTNHRSCSDQGKFMPTACEQKMIKARAGLVLDHPFFGSLALRLKMVEDPSCDTAWTDGVSLGYNPTWIDGLSLEETKGLWAHEVMHLAAAHHTRRQNRERVLWNHACDHAINGPLSAAGMTLLAGALNDPDLNEKCSEEIYGILKGRSAPQAGNSGQDGSQQGSSATGEGPDQNKGTGQGQGKQPGPDPTGGNQPDSPAPGSGSGQAQAKPCQPDPGMVGEVRDAPGKVGQPASQADLTQIAAEWKVAVAQAAQQAKAMGRMPGDLMRFVGGIIEPKLDWRDLLRRFIDQSAKNDYTFSPPNRRYVHLGLYLPSLHSRELGHVVVAADTSISVSQEEINAFAAEVSAILEEFQTSRVTVIYCDTKVAAVEEFEAQDLPLKLTPKGGGGTDFRPPFAWVEDQGLQPVCLIYLTDGECNRFPEPPDYPVLWVGTHDFTAPFGDFARLSV